jgi:hypothetical protein
MGEENVAACELSSLLDGDSPRKMPDDVRETVGKALAAGNGILRLEPAYAT